MYKHILIPTDGSRLSAAAARAGVRLAKVTGARVTGLFVAPPATPIVFKRLLPTRYMTPDQHAALIARGAAHFLAVVENAAAAAGVACECITVTGDFPAETILAVAADRKCDLVYMASHARRGLAAALLGSQTQKVLAHSKLPVLVHR